MAQRAFALAPERDAAAKARADDAPCGVSGLPRPKVTSELRRPPFAVNVFGEGRLSNVSVVDRLTNVSGGGLDDQRIWGGLFDQRIWGGSFDQRIWGGSFEQRIWG